MVSFMINVQEQQTCVSLFLQLQRKEDTTIEVFCYEIASQYVGRG